MSGEEKINALDFIINTLRDHEKVLSQLEEKLENIVSTLENTRTHARGLSFKGDKGKKIRSLVFHLNGVQVSIIIKEGEIHIIPRSRGSLLDHL